MGGAQAVAALAYGVEGVPKVDKIVGPGNLFVALAKRYVFGDVDIDSIAGPSEVVVMADESTRARFHGRRFDRPGRTCARREHSYHLDAPLLEPRPRNCSGRRRTWSAAIWRGKVWSSSAP